VLLPSTRRASKFWPAASFRELGRRLLSQADVRLLILGGPGEEPLLEEVRAGLPPELACTYAPAPIPDLAGVIRRSHLAIGNDTGPLHIAAAAGVPSVGLFGPTRGARNGPYGPHCGYVQSPTGQMRDISVDEVWVKAKTAGRM
jgi:heptosyltransferase-3